MSNWIFDFIKNITSTKKAELSFKFGDLVNMKLDPENKAVYLENQDSKPGDVDLLLYFLKPQIDGHQVIEIPHIEVQLDQNRKATDSELSAAKSAFDKYKQDLNEYHADIKKKVSASNDMHDHSMTDKEELEMTIQLIKDEITKEKDPSRLKLLKDDLQHSEMHLQTVSSLNKVAADIGFNSGNDAWYRVWVKQSEIQYDSIIEEIAMSEDTDDKKKEKMIERIKQISDKKLKDVEEYATEKGIQLYSFNTGDIAYDRLKWDELLNPELEEKEYTSSKMKATADKKDVQGKIAIINDKMLFVPETIINSDEELWEEILSWSTRYRQFSFDFPDGELIGYLVDIDTNFIRMEDVIKTLEIVYNQDYIEGQNVPIEDVFPKEKQQVKPSEIADEVDIESIPTLDSHEKRKRVNDLLDEYNVATPERKQFIERQLRELKASLDINALFKEWFKKYKNSKDLKEAYSVYKAEVSKTDLEVPSYKDWAKEQYNELAGFASKSIVAERDPEIDRKIDKARTILLSVLSTGYNIELLDSLFHIISTKTGLMPESIMDIYDELLHSGKIYESVNKAFVKGASLETKSKKYTKLDDGLFVDAALLDKYINIIKALKKAPKDSATLKDMDFVREQIHSKLVETAKNELNYPDDKIRYAIYDFAEDIFSFDEREAGLSIISRVVKKEDGYYVLSEKGKNLGGPYKSRSKAKKRLRQVEYFKHRANIQETENLINRMAKTKEEASQLKLLAIDKLVDSLNTHVAEKEQYPIDQEINDLIQTIEQLDSIYNDDKDIQTQISEKMMDELRTMLPTFKSYLKPVDRYIPTRMVIELIDRAKDILDI